MILDRDEIIKVINYSEQQLNCCNLVTIITEVLVLVENFILIINMHNYLMIAISDSAVAFIKIISNHVICN